MAETKSAGKEQTVRAIYCASQTAAAPGALPQKPPLLHPVGHSANQNKNYQLNLNQPFSLGKEWLKQLPSQQFKLKKALRKIKLKPNTSRNIPLRKKVDRRKLWLG